MPVRDQRGSRQRSEWARLYSLGLELAAAVAGFTLLGWWIDRHYGTSPRWLLICFSVGLVGGLYNFVRSSLQAHRASIAEEPSGEPTGRPVPPGREEEEDEDRGREGG